MAAGDLSREDGRGGKHGHVGSVSRGLGAFGDPSAVLYRSPDCCGKFATNGNVRAVARIDPPTCGRNSVAGTKVGDDATSAAGGSVVRMAVIPMRFARSPRRDEPQRWVIA